MKRAVIFDMDGVMIDSEPLWEKTERILLARRNIDYSPEYRDLIVGLNQNDSGKLLWQTFSLRETLDEIISERLDILTEIYKQELDIIPGVTPLLKELRVRGYILAVASSSPLRVINFVLDMFSLHQYFDAVVSGECINFGKPHPDIYLHTAERLGVKPSECVAIEDSINGVRSAKSAGMRCIAIPDKRLSRGKFDIADLILENTDDLDITMIEGL
jgi:HAD superfamily hydrolase (TIGR01509 family)